MLSAGLLVGAALLGMVGGVALCFRDTVVDADEFGRRAVQAMASSDAREVIARRVTAEVVAQVPETAVVRPLIEVAVQGALASDAFQQILAAATADLHRTVLEGDDDTLTLRLVDLVLVVKAQLAATQPQLAERIPGDLTDALVQVNADIAPAGAQRLLEVTRVLAVLAPVGALALLAAALALMRQRADAALLAGAVVVAVGAALRLTPAVGSMAIERLLDPPSDELVLTTALWRALTAELVRWSGWLAVAGVAVAAAATLGGRGLRLESAVDRLSAIVTPPARGRGRALWLAVAGLLGALLLVRGESVVRFAASASGAALLLVVVAEAARAARAPLLDVGRSGTHGVSARGVRTAAVVLIVVVVGAGVGVGVRFAPGTDRAAAMYAAAGEPGCNGSVLLCDRPLDQVAFAATHNSTADTTAGFTNGNQESGVRAQLDAGYRGLLIDVYFGLRSPRVPFVITDRAAPSAADRTDLVAEVGEPAVRTAEQLRTRALDAGGSRDVYTCHAFCELGATELVPQLRAIREWLERHPRDVLIVFLQDEIPARDVVAAFEDADLAPYAYRHRRGGSWPTLGDLISRDERLLVLSENGGGSADWYHDGFALAEETPYTFRSAAEFTCEPNRGGTGKPLLLVNHFVTPPSKPTAAEVNRQAVLGSRLADCQRRRQQVPNLVAVDFFAVGDTVAVVDALNGVSR